MRAAKRQSSVARVSSAPEHRARRKSCDAAFQTSGEAPSTCYSRWLVFRTRSILTLQVAGTKIFLGGFMWQAAGFFAIDVIDQSTESAGFAFVTGIGDALGVLIGQMLLSGMLAYWQWNGWLEPLSAGAVLVCGSICSGTVWQPLVNGLSTAGLGFSAAATLTGLCCGTAFLIGMLLGIRLFRTLTEWSYCMIVSLAISIMGATAVFVATDVHFDGNWLRDVVGERRGDEKVVDCLRAGLSTALGFIVVQIVQNVVVPVGALWTDDIAATRRPGFGDGYQAYGTVGSQNAQAEFVLMAEVDRPMLPEHHRRVSV